jgi:hypothetical protein
MRARSRSTDKPVTGFVARQRRRAQRALGGPLGRRIVVGGAAVAAGVVVVLLVALPSGTPQTPPSVTGPPSARVFVPPTGIPHDCSADVGPLLRSWLWSLPRGTPASPLVVDFPANSCYLVNESLYLRGFTNTTLNGRNATFRQVAPTVQSIGPLPTVSPYCGSDIDKESGTTISTIPIIWWFEGGCDITITNMVIIGPNTAGVVGSQNNSGIQLSGVQRAVIQGVTINDVDGDFVTMSGLHEAASGQASFPTTDVTIQGNSFSRSGRQGITPEYVDHVSITHNSLRGVAASVIDLEADSTGGCACNVEVDHNTFAGPASYLVAGITGLSIRHFDFTDNRLVDGAQLKIQLAPQLPSSDVVISGNSGSTGSTWPWPSVGIAYSIGGDSAGLLDGVQVSGNSIPAPSGGRPFVRAGKQASNVGVSHNVISGGNKSTTLLNDGPPSNHACGNRARVTGPAFDAPC